MLCHKVVLRPKYINLFFLLSFFLFFSLGKGIKLLMYSQFCSSLGRLVNNKTPYSYKLRLADTALLQPNFSGRLATRPIQFPLNRARETPIPIFQNSPPVLGLILSLIYHRTLLLVTLTFFVNTFSVIIEFNVHF